MKNYGQYNVEYKNSKCFWGEEPAKYVKLVLDYIDTGSALDLGAGDGKNSFFLAKKGFDVTAVEISPYAVRNFLDRLIREEEEKSGLMDNIKIVLGDVAEWNEQKEYDLVISYGLLHCFESEEKIAAMIDNMMRMTKKGGLNVVCAFTDELPVPEVQKYLEPTLLSAAKYREYYKDWQELNFEGDIIEHAHPTSNIVHKHSLCRLIARK